MLYLCQHVSSQQVQGIDLEPRVKPKRQFDNEAVADVADAARVVASVKPLERNIDARSRVDDVHNGTSSDDVDNGMTCDDGGPTSTPSLAALHRGTSSTQISCLSWHITRGVCAVCALELEK